MAPSRRRPRRPPATARASRAGRAAVGGCVLLRLLPIQQDSLPRRTRAASVKRHGRGCGGGRGGPAGLQAALTLARMRFDVVVVDARTPSNASAHAIGGLLGAHDVAPLELLATGRRQLAELSGQVTVLDAVAGLRSRDGVLQAAAPARRFRSPVRRPLRRRAAPATRRRLCPSAARTDGARSRGRRRVRPNFGRGRVRRRRPRLHGARRRPSARQRPARSGRRDARPCDRGLDPPRSVNAWPRRGPRSSGQLGVALVQTYDLG